MHKSEVVRYLIIKILSLNLLLMKTMFIIVLTALMVGVTGVEKTKAADRGVPLKITVIEKCQYVEGGVWISTVNEAYEIYEFTTDPISNYAVLPGIISPVPVFICRLPHLMFPEFLLGLRLRFIRILLRMFW